MTPHDGKDDLRTPGEVVLLAVYALDLGSAADREAAHAQLKALADPDLHPPTPILEAFSRTGFPRFMHPEEAELDTEAMDMLTPREREIARLVMHGASNPQIADQLVVSRRTVEHHVASILRKLELASRHDLAARITVR